MAMQRRNNEHTRRLCAIVSHLLFGLVAIFCSAQMVQSAFAAPTTELTAAHPTTGHSAAVAPKDTAPQQTATANDKAGGTKISIANFAFTPAEITIAPGETVTWTNDDGAPHGLEYQDGAKGTDLLLPGATFSRQFDRPGA